MNDGRQDQSLNLNPTSNPQIQLPRIEEIAEYQQSPAFIQTLLTLPPLSSEGTQHSRKPMGAPIKPKNQFARLHGLKNTQGKKFKFSFLPQILVSHLLHLLGLKQKSRSQVGRWLRSYSPQGREIQALILDLTRRNLEYFNFKRIVSCQELKKWLLGEIYCTPVDAARVSELRIKVFRLFCILKCIDLEENLQEDFNLAAGNSTVSSFFRQYLVQYIWEELGADPISNQEIRAALGTEETITI